jgi:hypothetical protein
VNVEQQPSASGCPDQRSPLIDGELLTVLGQLRRAFGWDQVRVVQVAHGQRNDSMPSQPSTAAQRTRPAQPTRPRMHDREEIVR